MFGRVRIGLCFAVAVLSAWTASAADDEEKVSDPVRNLLDSAVSQVRPALVRIAVVSSDYQEGRETKFETFGSGVIIDPRGYVVTNHHVAGRAVRLQCTLATKEVVEAELTGTDPLTDVAVIQLPARENAPYPTARFGDSSGLRVGDMVLAMGSPMALSQSATAGIVSNTEMIMPQEMGDYGMVTLEGENVGALVRWIGHDASIFGGNSGGPLVNLNGEIVGINEINVGLGGAIPGNLAREVAVQLIAVGEVRRSWTGLTIQPRLRQDLRPLGALVAHVMEGSPAGLGGIVEGDLLVSLNGEGVDVRFPEQMPGMNQRLASLPMGAPATAVVLRGEKELSLTLTPVLRGKTEPQERVVREWGITARNLSRVLAKELRRDSEDGVQITTISPGGAVGDAKPAVLERDVIVAVNEQPVRDVEHLRQITSELLSGSAGLAPVLAMVERRGERILVFVRIGVRDLPEPAQEVRKAWLPVATQVITRDMAQALGRPQMTGFRVTRVYADGKPEEMTLETGDFIVAVDGEALTASAPEDYEELDVLVRQYKIGSVAEFTVIRNGATVKLPVLLAAAPPGAREARKYRNDSFDMTVADVTFGDRMREQWRADQSGVIVTDLRTGGWAAVGQLQGGDLIQEVNGRAISGTEDFEAVMAGLEKARAEWVVFKVLRGIYTRYLEVEPKWEPAS